MPSLTDQFRRHSVALISLSVALTSLAYNTWRNEQTEANRNVRNAGIEYLLKLGDLEQVVFFVTYDAEDQRSSPREGWAYMITIRDLASLTGDSAVAATDELFAAWEDNWSLLEGAQNRTAAQKISDAADQARESVLQILANLD